MTPLDEYRAAFDHLRELMLSGRGNSPQADDVRERVYRLYDTLADAEKQVVAEDVRRRRRGEAP